MSDEGDDFEVTIKVQRGTSTDDRDTLRAKVSASTIDGLEAKVEALEDRLEQWADDLRDVQPTAETVRDHAALDDDQTELGEGSA